MSLKNNVIKINNNLCEFRLNLIDINNKIKDFDDLVVKIIDILEIPDEIEQHITTLDNMLYYIDKTLLIISVIPSISTQIKILKIGINSLRSVVHPQKNKIETLDNTYIEPIRDTLSVFHEKIKFTTKEIDVLCNNIVKFKHKFNSTTNVIMVSRKKTHEMNEKLVKLNLTCDECNFSVNKLNGLISNLNHIIDKINYQFRRVKNKYTKLANICKNVVDIVDKLNYLDNMLDPLIDSLNHTVSVPYSFKIKVKKPKQKKIKSWTSFTKFIVKEITVWEWEWDIQTKQFKFTVNQVLKGIDEVDDMINIIEDKLRYQANKILNPILKKINFKIDIPPILNIDILEDEINMLKNLLSLDDILRLENSMSELMDEIEFLNKYLSNQHF